MPDEPQKPHGITLFAILIGLALLFFQFLGSDIFLKRFDIC